ncbi:hypothetical protein EON73_04500 [bacterium]|nr:MAG: hypothetical protein EON73_04500 [bacterium]
MANDNLAQSEQILNLLQQSLEEISDKQEVAYNSLVNLQKYSYQTQNNLDKAWAKTVDLVKKVEQLRLTCCEFEKDG